MPITIYVTKAKARHVPSLEPEKKTHTRMCACVCVHTPAHVAASIMKHTRPRTFLCTCTYTCLHACLYKYQYQCQYTCAHTYVYWTHFYTHVYAHGDAHGFKDVNAHTRLYIETFVQERSIVRASARACGHGRITFAGQPTPLLQAAHTTITGSPHHYYKQHIRGAWSAHTTVHMPALMSVPMSQRVPVDIGVQFGNEGCRQCLYRPQLYT